MVEEAETSSSDATVEAVKGKRERSRVDFPYTDLLSATEMASAVLQKSGGTCDETQLAVWLNQSVSGGTFRARLSAAKMFGLLEGGNKALTLTALGRQVADSRSAPEARVDAFLHIELYKSLYEKLHGFHLPPAAAIERHMVILGVVTSQSDRARQAFVKSATQAGFIDSQTGRFVKPGNSPENQQEGEDGGGKHKRDNGGDPPLHPFILGLLKALPQPDSEWEVADRAKWLQTASSIFGLIYKGDGSIRIDVEASRTAH